LYPNHTEKPMDINAILNNADHSVLVVTPGIHEDVVVAVPHHAPSGASKLPCKEHPEADENAGFLGYYISRLLNCRSVIACNYFIDPNKNKDTDYCRLLLSLKPKILLEIHGHGGRSANFDIEISSGSHKRNRWSMELANRLGAKLQTSPQLKNYTISGNFNDIYFKATRTFTITTDEWLAFHIELPNSIRKSQIEYKAFCESLSEIIKDMLGLLEPKFS